MANKRRETSYKEIDGKMVSGVCCSKCSQWKTLDSYSPDTRSPLGIRSKCGECIREEMRIKNAEKRRIVRLDQLSDALRVAVELELGIKTKGAE